MRATCAAAVILFDVMRLIISGEYKIHGATHYDVKVRGEAILLVFT
jgi:hypothetical protein